MDLKEGVTVEDVELVLGVMCNVVKYKYGDERGGFIAGQVYRNSGSISEEGAVGTDDSHKARRVQQNMGDIVIVTF